MNSQETHQLIQLPSTELAEFLTQFGVIQPPSLLFVSNIVRPVSIVDSRITLNAQVTATQWDATTSIGIVNNPAINSMLADTAGLAAGRYEFEAVIGGYDVDTWMAIEHRDAANAATLWELLESGNTRFHVHRFTLTLGLNERVRIRVGVGTGAGSQYCGRISYRRL